MLCQMFVSNTFKVTAWRSCHLLILSLVIVLIPRSISGNDGFLFRNSDNIDHQKGHACSHQPPNESEVTLVHLEPHHVIRKRSVYQPLRIKVHYDQSVKNLPEEKFAVINNTILPQALNYWKEALLVKPLGVPIRLNRKCANNKAFFQNNRGQIQQFCVERCELITTCGEVTVPETHLEVSKVSSLQLSLCVLIIMYVLQVCEKNRK